MSYISFHCTIKDVQEDIDFQVNNEESDITIKEFRAWVQAKYQLQGAVSLYHKGKKLTNLMATLKDVLRPGDALVILTNKSIAVASGGVGMGANASSRNGGLATATGGFGTGGTLKQGLLRAGRGLGGDGLGTSGGAGEGYGGTAASLLGEVHSGRGTGGSFTDRSATRHPTST
ncbi:hypothetical protein F4779DRAFT_588548 [Xylariaceae sp. FL0662B]|nr:hypothetical protein F4779DRAFT_588548 [Xylariaceae sp. FL0662B]